MGILGIVLLTKEYCSLSVPSLFLLQINWSSQNKTNAVVAVNFFY